MINTLPYANSMKGADAKPLMSDDRAQMVQPVGGRWYHAAKQGKLFIGNSAAAGLVLPIYSATAQLFGLWNKSNSGVNAVLASLRMTYVSTTGAAGGYVLGLLQNAGGSVGTAAPISAFTPGAPLRGMMSEQTGGNRVSFTPSAATVTTGLMVVGRNLGINQLVTTAADATTTPWTAKEDFDGDVILPPGNALFVCGNIATLSVWAVSLTWAEEPV